MELPASLGAISPFVTPAVVNLSAKSTEPNLSELQLHSAWGYVYCRYMYICMYVYVIHDSVFFSQTAFAFYFDFKYFRPAPAVYT